MRLLIQISVSGFKIFDTATLPHQTEEGSYALMSEINETQKGNTEYRTHITGLDSHGIPSGVLSLFSTSGLDYILQDVKIEEKRERLFYVSQNGITRDFHGRKCEVSFMLISESRVDKTLINRFASLVLVKQDSFILSNMQGVLSTAVRNEEVVLAYNEILFQSIIKYVNDFEFSHSDSQLYRLASDDIQCVVVPDVNVFKDGVKEIARCFNEDPYCVINSSSMPLEKNSLSVDLVPEKILSPSFLSGGYQSSRDEFLGQIIEAGREIYNYLKKI